MKKNPLIAAKIKSLVGVLKGVGDKATRVACLLGVLLGETSAEGLVSLRGEASLLRIRRVYGKVYGAELADHLGRLLPEGDVPCLLGRGGKALSRVTLWRRVGKIGLVGLRRLSLAFRKFFMEHCETREEARDCASETGFVLGTPTSWVRVYAWWPDAPDWCGRVRRFI